MNGSTSQEITNWVQTISYYAPLVLIPLSLVLCILLGSARLPRTLIWLASVTLGYAVIQLGIIIAFYGAYNQPVDMLPTRTDVFIGENLAFIKSAVEMILYALQLVTETSTHRKSPCVKTVRVGGFSPALALVLWS